MKPRYVAKICAVHYYWPMKSKLKFAGKARVVTGVEFQENPSSGSRDTTMKVHCSPVMCLRRLLDGDFKEYPSNPSQYSTVNALGTPKNVFLINGRSLRK